MEKEEIIKKFLKSNLQIDRSALDYFLNNQSKIEIFFLKIKDQKLTSPIITKNTVENILSQTTVHIKILKELSKQNGQTSINTEIELLNEKYDNISNILVNKSDLINLISINKINEKLSKFSLIVMIREKDDEEKAILVEDKTGTKNILVQNEEDFSSIDEDDVIGVVVETNNGNYVCTKIVWPDAPFRKEFLHTEGEINCIFVSNIINLEKFLEWIKNNKKENLVIFIQGEFNNYDKILDLSSKTKIICQDENISNSEEGNVKKIPHNSILSVDGITIMILNKDFLDSASQNLDNEPEDMVVNIIKKRFIYGKVNYLQNRNAEGIFINPIPDIVSVFEAEKTENTNYKNTTILAVSAKDSESFYIVNLKTRETIKVNLT